MKVLIQIMLIVIYFAWQPNTEPDMSHYQLYQRIGSTIKLLNEYIPHPTSTTSVDIPANELKDAWYYLKAVDTEGFTSYPSNEYKYDKLLLLIKED